MRKSNRILQRVKSGIRFTRIGWFFALVFIVSINPIFAIEASDHEKNNELSLTESLENEFSPFKQFFDTTITIRRIDSIAHLIGLEQKNKNREAEATLWIELGKIYLETHYYDAADSSFILADKLIPKANLPLKAAYHLDVANIYQQFGSSYRATQYYQTALNRFKVVKDKKGIALAMHGLAKIAEKLGDFTEAIGLLHQTLDIYQDIGDSKGIALVEIAIGSILQKWGKKQVAIKHYNEAYSYFSGINDYQKMILIQIKLGQIALASSQFQQALEHFSNAINTDPKGIPANVKGLLFINLGNVYQQTKDYNRALSYYTNASTIFENSKDQIGQIRALQQLGESYISLQYYQKADSVVRQSLALALQNNYKEYQMNGWLLLSEINNLTKEYKTAFHCLKNATKMKDEMFSQEGNRLVNELSVRYETDKINEAYRTLLQKNQKVNTALKRQQDTGSITIILSTFIILVSLIIIIFTVVRARESKKGYALLALKNKKIFDQKEILAKLNLKLIQSREQYRSIVENASVGMYQTTPEGKVRFANTALKRMLRFPENVDISKTNLNEEQPKRQDFINLIEEKGVLTGREDIWKRYDGTFLDVNESAWLVKNAKSETHYYEGVVEDISKRKAAEMALTESEQKLRLINEELTEKNIQIEKSKNEAVKANEIKSVFLANVSHEIRTPMNSIIGFSEILAQRVTDKQLLYYIKAIQSSSSNLLALLNDILDLSKIQSNEIELIYDPISLYKIAQDIVEMFQLSYREKKLKLVLEFSKPFPELIKMDGLRMRQILINLIGNAVKFTDKGNILVSVSASPVFKDYCDLKIEISDTGIGIAEEEFETIFEAFKQSKYIGDKAHSGTGLGLSITKQLIESMGGNIYLESHLHQGTTFFIHLPNIEVAHSSEINPHLNYPPLPLCNGDVNKSLCLDNAPESPVPEMDNEFQSKLLLSFGNNWTKLNKSHLVSELSMFSEHLMRFSKTENTAWLYQLAEELFEACQRFDVDKIEYLNKILKDIFVKRTQK